MRRFQAADIPWRPIQPKTKEQREREFRKMMEKYEAMANAIFGPPEADKKQQMPSYVPVPVTIQR